MHYLLELSSSANPDQNFWVSKLSKNSVLGAQMTCWTHRWLSPWPSICHFWYSHSRSEGNGNFQALNKWLILPTRRVASLMWQLSKTTRVITQGLRQDFKIGCPKLAIVKFLGVQIFKGDHNILRF